MFDIRSPAKFFFTQLVKKFLEEIGMATIHNSI